MTTTLGLATEIVDATVRDRAVEHLRGRGVMLPRFAELADPAKIPDAIEYQLEAVDPLAPSAANLFRVHLVQRRR